MDLEEGLEVIRREMLKQAKKHKNSALKRVAAYKINGEFSSLIEGARLDVISDALKGVGKAMTVKKIQQWNAAGGVKNE